MAPGSPLKIGEYRDDWPAEVLSSEGTTPRNNQARAARLPEALL
jgi:hypothetical protein